MREPRLRGVRPARDLIAVASQRFRAAPQRRKVTVAGAGQRGADAGRRTTGSEPGSGADPSRGEPTPQGEQPLFLPPGETELPPSQHSLGLPPQEEDPDARGCFIPALVPIAGIIAAVIFGLIFMNARDDEGGGGDAARPDPAPSVSATPSQNPPANGGGGAGGP